jgi:tRNA 2-thiouridine synthesizing protein A
MAEATGDGGAVTLEVDARGLLCPLPVLRLAKRARGLPPGSTVRLLADDPAAHVDVPHWCAEGGHAYLGAEGDAHLVRLG